MRGLLVVVSLCACTRDNPLFGAAPGDGSGGTGGSETSVASDATQTSTIGDSSTNPDVTGPDSVGETAAETTGETAGDGSTSSAETGNACTLPEFGQLIIEPGEANPAVDPQCGTVWSSPQGVISVEPGKILLGECGCPCGVDPGTAVTIGVAGVEIPALPECGYVVAWAKPGMNECVWAGVAVFGTGSQPIWLASSAMAVPPAVFGGLTLHRTVDRPCASDMCNEAGGYALVFDGVPGDNTISMAEPPKAMKLPFFASLDYLVDNVSAVLDETCFAHLAWTATYAQ